MKVRLIRAARIRHNPGEIVEVSPAEAGFLLSTGSAEAYYEPEMPRETPEDMLTAETPETPEKPEKPAGKKETKSKK